MGSISWADLIVLAANTALEAAANNQFRLQFCPGRVDDTQGDAWEHLKPKIEGAYSEKAYEFLVSTHMTRCRAENVALTSYHNNVCLL